MMYADTELYEEMRNEYCIGTVLHTPPVVMIEV